MRYLVMLVAALAAALLLSRPAQSAQQPAVVYLRDTVPLSVNGEPISERQWRYLSGSPPGILGGKEYNKALLLDPIARTGPRSEIAFYLQGKWTLFEAVVGVDDRQTDERLTVQFEVFGDDRSLVTTPLLKIGSEPVRISVPVAHVMRVKIAMRMDNEWRGGRPMCVWGDARVVRGDKGPPPPPGVKPTYIITVEPKALDELAQKLARALARDPSLQGKQVQVAVSSFRLVSGRSGYDIDPAVADNVREDLTSALLNLDPPVFKLVERVQPDKALDELKLGQTGLIDRERRTVV